MTPFTYHLYHIPTDTHYYGVRYHKNCLPSELWTTYFSSSPIVHQLIEEYGLDSFVPKVRKIFKTAEQARRWEFNFLSKVNASDNDKWLNRHNGGTHFVGPITHTEKTKQKIKASVTGMKRSEETKRKQSVAAKKREELRREQGWTFPEDAKRRALETRKSRIASGDINPYSEERNRKMGASKKGTKRHYLPDGSFIMIKP